MEYINYVIAVMLIGWTFVNDMIGSAKGFKGGTVIIISILLTPLIGSIYVIGMPNASDGEK